MGFDVTVLTLLYIPFHFISLFGRAKARAALLRSAVLTTILQSWLPRSSEDIKDTSFCLFLFFLSRWLRVSALFCLSRRLMVSGQEMSLAARDGREHDPGNFIYSACYTLLLNGHHPMLLAFAQRWPSILGVNGCVQGLFLQFRVQDFPRRPPCHNFFSHFESRQGSHGAWPGARRGCLGVRSGLLEIGGEGGLGFTGFRA